MGGFAANKEVLTSEAWSDRRDLMRRWSFRRSVRQSTEYSTFHFVLSSRRVVIVFLPVRITDAEPP
ncbi:hypothetical protein PpBr36_02712 [Pyricularia pennisetigena]|uniref:hypothetical protein n=1 Tax=Pyricularia pennisetigena TaxID=1578925 RepID=UPI00115083FD|nr:hypothetical protein PpBr36_02712 [Pyricularia pennisetigena]TLS30550.1 hypothetical protein PpBr36_02712 [Pyricularia pennisetigena]